MANGVSQPPPYLNLAAAAVGGFVGAVVGVIVASSNGDDGGSAALDPADKPAVEVVAEHRED